MSKYDAIRSIRMYTPSKETLKFMANRIKKLEHLEIEMGFQPQELLSKEWQKTFCDFLKSQENTLTEITFLFNNANNNSLFGTAKYISTLTVGMIVVVSTLYLLT